MTGRLSERTGENMLEYLTNQNVFKLKFEGKEENIVQVYKPIPSMTSEEKFKDTTEVTQSSANIPQMSLLYVR